MKIYRIIPLDSKGEQGGNAWVTHYESVALQATVEGHDVYVAEVPQWKNVTAKLVEAE